MLRIVYSYRSALFPSSPELGKNIEAAAAHPQGTGWEGERRRRRTYCDDFRKKGGKKRSTSLVGGEKSSEEGGVFVVGRGEKFCSGCWHIFSDLPIICRQTRDWEEFDKVFFPCVAGKSWWILIPLLRKATTCTLLPLASYSSQIHASPLAAAQHQVVGSLAGLILTGEGGREEKETTGGGRQSLIIREKKGRREGKGKVRLVGGGHHQGSTKEKNILPLSPRTYLVAWEGG